MNVCRGGIGQGWEGRQDLMLGAMKHLKSLRKVACSDLDFKMFLQLLGEG